MGSGNAGRSRGVCKVQYIDHRAVSKEGAAAAASGSHSCLLTTNAFPLLILNAGCLNRCHEVFLKAVNSSELEGPQ